MNRYALLLLAGLIAVGIGATLVADEDSAAPSAGAPDRPPPPPGDEGGPPPPRGDRPPPPPPPHPLEQALDADDDGVISAEEIAGAVEALKKLDRNGDGKLTGREFRPPHPPHGPPPPDGEGPRGRRPMGPPPRQ
jgi:hypothetical protein